MENKFYVGQRVKCPCFGKGEVVAINELAVHQIRVAFDNPNLSLKDYIADGRLSPNFLPTLEPDEPEVIEWPEVMNYLATDASGLRFFFRYEPIVDEENKEWVPEMFGMPFVELDRIEYPNWRESLIKREKLKYKA